MNIDKRNIDLYDTNLAAMLLRTAVDEFRSMPFHMKLSYHIDDAVSWCERFYSSVTGTLPRWETDTDRKTRERLRYGH